MKRSIGTLFLMILLALIITLPGAARNQYSTPHDLDDPLLATGSREQTTPGQTVPRQIAVRSFVIRGRVVDAYGAPQVGLRVEAVLPGDVPVASTRSEAGGRFTFADLQSGSYRLRVMDADGRTLLLAASSECTVTESEAQHPFFHELVVLPTQVQTDDNPERSSVTPPAKIAPPKAPADSVVSIQATGQITGVVTAQDTGLPVSSVSVSAYDENYDYLTGSYTDWDGKYSLTGLDTGNAYLLFQIYGQNYLSEWYENKPDFDTADPVAVVDGGITPDINAILEPGGQISGTVTAADTGLPLENVSISAWIEGTYHNYYGWTDSDGKYLLNGMPTGDYIVEFNASSQPNYISEYYNDKPDPASADPVHVIQGSLTGDIDAELALGGKITGLVSADGSGLPLTDINVTAYDASGDSVVGTSVSSSGVYTITGLANGSYRLYFSPHYSGSSADYISEYYNNKYDLESADPVAVVAPNTVSSVDISLGLGGKITGQVTAQGSGNPIDNVNITLYTSNNQYVDSVSTEPSGAYTFTALLTGGYKLRFQPSSSGTYADYIPEYYDDKTNLNTADVVDVTAPDTTANIDAELAPGGKITGLVIAGDTQLPLENVDVDVYNSSGNWIDDVDSDASGVYTITRLASGNYYLRFSPSIADQNYVQEYYNDKHDRESADPVAVVAPNTVSGINASLQRGGSLTGRVTGEDTGQGLPDVWVEVFDCYGFDVRGATTDLSGYYTVTGLLAGSYSVGFFPEDNGMSRAYIEEYFDNKSTWERSNSVMVASGETTTGIDAALARGAQISGRVTAADGGAPLEEVDIEIYNLNGWYIGDALTSATGVYTTAGLPSGDYYLWFGTYEWSSSRDYVDEYYNNKVSFGDADPLTLTSPHILSGIDVVLSRGGRISGRVTAEGSGVPLQDVYIDAYNPDTGQWDYAYIDNNGYYTMHGVASGSYQVDFDPNGVDDQYIWEFYNNKTPKQVPDLVVVSAPGEVSGINAALGLGGAIDCSVKAEDTNAPLYDVYVAAYDGDGDRVASDWTEEDGLCELNGLPSGEYRLWFQDTVVYSYQACLINRVRYVEEYYNDKPDLEFANPISVTAPNIVTGIEAWLSVGEPLPPIGRGSVFLPMVSR